VHVLLHVFVQIINTLSIVDSVYNNKSIFDRVVFISYLYRRLNASQYMFTIYIIICSISVRILSHRFQFKFLRWMVSGGGRGKKAGVWESYSGGVSTGWSRVELRKTSLDQYAVYHHHPPAPLAPLPG